MLAGYGDSRGREWTWRGSGSAATRQHTRNMSGQGEDRGKEPRAPIKIFGPDHQLRKQEMSSRSTCTLLCRDDRQERLRTIRDRASKQREGSANFINAGTAWHDASNSGDRFRVGKTTPLYPRGRWDEWPAALSISFLFHFKFSPD